MSKKSRSEGNRVASLIKANKAEFYIADVDLDDNTNDVTNAVTTIIKTLGKMRAAFMVVSAGIKVLTVIAYVPTELQDRINASDWLGEAVKGLPVGTLSGDDHIRISAIDVDTPFKLKDMVRSNGFKYLTDKGCMGEEESSDEFIGLDDL